MVFIVLLFTAFYMTEGQILTYHGGFRKFIYSHCKFVTVINCSTTYPEVRIQQSLFCNAATNTSIGNTGIGNTDVDNTGIGNTGIGNTDVDNAGIGNTGIGNTDVDNTGIGNTDVDNTGIGNTGIGNTDVDNTGIGNTGIGNTDVDNTGIGNTDVDNTGIGNTDVDNTGIGNTHEPSYLSLLSNRILSTTSRNVALFKQQPISAFPNPFGSEFQLIATTLTFLQFDMQ